MATFTSSTHTFVSPHRPFLTHSTSRASSSFLVASRGKKGNNSFPLKLNLARGRSKRVCCWCNKDADLALEAEILEFMKKSKKPMIFPSKKELMDGGRMDLVEGIKRQGGWLAMGWHSDDDDDDDDEDNGFQQNSVKTWDFEAIRERVYSEDESCCSDTSSSALHSPSSSGTSLEVAAEDNGGIEGILSRLERERNINLGFGFREKSSHINNCSQSNDSEEEQPLVQASMDATVGGSRRRKLVSFSHGTGPVSDNGINSSQSQSLSGVDGLRNATWREWSLQRAGFTGKEFEGDEIIGIRDKSSELDRRKESHASGKDINGNEIQSRLESLKSELTYVLHSLKSNVDEVLSEKVDGSSVDSLHTLSDAWEFQENEIMNAQDKLRSIRARLAVLEGKMALAIIDTQKTVEEKQKRIDHARRALHLLRSVCIVWPNFASEVLLAGSFDGWATQRKMEKSNTGVFSVRLKLYPGKYEIKFIVDGEWKIDPLRPIVNNNGFENNLLIVT